MKNQIHTKSMNTGIFKVDVVKPVFLGDTNKLIGFCEKFPGSSNKPLFVICSFCTLYS